MATKRIVARNWIQLGGMLNISWKSNDLFLLIASQRVECINNDNFLLVISSSFFFALRILHNSMCRINDQQMNFVTKKV